MTPAPRAPSCPANSEPVAIFDSIVPGRLPPTSPVVAGYVDGSWPTYAHLATSFRQATVLSIATDPANRAMILDVEKGDATPREAVAWVREGHRLGVKRPCLYMSLGAVATFDDQADMEGITRGEYRLWTAHWTGKPHICSARCGLGSIERPGATQWTDNPAEGVDVSRSTWGWVRAVWASGMR